MLLLALVAAPATACSSPPSGPHPQGFAATSSTGSHHCTPDQPMTCVRERPAGAEAWSTRTGSLPDGQLTPDQFIDHYYRTLPADQIAQARGVFGTEGLVAVGHRQWKAPDGTAMDLLVLVFRGPDGAATDAGSTGDGWRGSDAHTPVTVPGLPDVAAFHDLSLGTDQDIVDVVGCVGRTELLAYYYPAGHAEGVSSTDLANLAGLLRPERDLLATQNTGLFGGIGN